MQMSKVMNVPENIKKKLYESMITKKKADCEDEFWWGQSRILSENSALNASNSRRSSKESGFH